MLAALDGMGVHGLLCLGDLVGYGADPDVVVETLASREAVAVAGNHDDAVRGGTPLAWFHPHARRALEWTAGRLRPDHLRFLAGLPVSRPVAGARLVHASPRDPTRWPYLLHLEDGAEALRACEEALIFVGHSHVPALWVQDPDGRVRFRPGAGAVRLEPGHRYLVNVGSVGQPRDGRPAASFAVWDPEARTVEVRRMAYDAAEARRRIHAAGLPRWLGDRLLRGR